jgi:hypothetical protein
LGWQSELPRREQKLLDYRPTCAAWFLTTKNLVKIDANGKPLKPNQKASSETPMHLAVYGGTDAQAIVHVHPPMVLAFSLTHESFMPVSFEEKYTIGEVPIIPQDTPTVTKPEKGCRSTQVQSRWSSSKVTARWRSARLSRGFLTHRLARRVGALPIFKDERFS